jgi:pyrimidine-specific ribonucleoside hydrolase
MHPAMAPGGHVIVQLSSGKEYRVSVKQVIIDCDPGIDDALALFAAFASDRLFIRGITTVAGNVPVTLTARNALALCTLAGQDIEVASGATGPLEGEVHTASDVHGQNGLGDVELPLTGQISTRGADQLLYEELIKAGGELEIIALGPLTNLAILLERHPDVQPYIKKLTLMGGSLGRGNVTPFAEFNFYADPLAADRVLRSGVPIVMFGLDVTNHALLLPDQIDEIESWGGPVLTPLVQMIRFYQKFYKSKGMDGLKMHDPLAVAGVIDSRLTEGQAYALGVETKDRDTLGKVCILEDPRTVHVCLKVHQEKFSPLFMNLLKSYQM